MDHRQFIAGLSAKDRADLTAKSDSKGLLALGFHFGGILVCGGMIAYGIPGWPLLMVLQGILIMFLFTLLHETIHRTAFKTVWINDWVARICGFLILLPSNWFRYFHFAHHRHTQDPDHDPELAGGKPDNWWQYIVYVSGVPTWASEISTLIANAMGRCRDGFVPSSGHKKVRHEAIVSLAVYCALVFVSVAVRSDLLLYVWILPCLLGQPFLRLYLLAEHGRCPFVANMLENSRTTATNALVRRLAWNMPYHAEHHSYPAVPFFKLPALHKLIESHLTSTSDGYRQFHKDYVTGFSEHNTPHSKPGA
ncbi:fatty acid desaturase family protein [Roseibium sp. SCP14]|uniref:fatty acid desaturase family protein n=1 Tax=Roseibium sp. SCP14 TaxID=3141375 RepID=UPI003334F532